MDYSSLPEPRSLRRTLVVKFLWGESQFVLGCTAGSIRTLNCDETNKELEWLHCKAVFLEDLKKGGHARNRTFLIPVQYIVSVTRGPHFKITCARKSEDVAVFAPSKPDPPHALASEEVRRLISEHHLIEGEVPVKEYLYDGFVSRISKRFEEHFKDIEATHNFDYGQEFEVALCETLARILPEKFAVCRGHVVTAVGDQAGDDIIIYDRMRFPTLRSLTNKDYSRKERVPIDAVYAYIEAKHTLSLEGNDGQSLQKAVLQVSRVKMLCSRRPAVSLSQVAPHVDMSAATVHPLPGWPSIRNPIYGAVISRQIRLKSGSPLLDNPQEIHRHLLTVGFHFEMSPDFVVAGQKALLIPVTRQGTAGEGNMPSPFFLLNESDMSTVMVDGIAFGAGLSILLWALDWIQLGDMPWPEILRDCMPASKSPTDP